MATVHLAPIPSFIFFGHCVFDQPKFFLSAAKRLRSLQTMEILTPGPISICFGYIDSSSIAIKDQFHIRAERAPKEYFY